MCIFVRFNKEGMCIFVRFNKEGTCIFVCDLIRRVRAYL